MDEVDKIIIHSLRQIGCTIESDTFSLANFTPELLVSSVATCLLEIKPNTTMPTSLPEGMAQRFTVASSLADGCAACGYRNDIGYQTFLYPNTVDVRRLFMFLIEQLPKDNRSAPEPISRGPIGEYEMLKKEIKEKLLKEMQATWIPQYCKLVGNRKQIGCSSYNNHFSPQLNLNILGVEPCTKEVQLYLQQQAPNIFQQTASEKYDLISSVLHKNSMDLYSTHTESQDLKLYTIEPLATTSSTVTTRNTDSLLNKESNDNDVDKLSTLSSLEKLTEMVNALKNQNDAVLSERKATSIRINTLKTQQTQLQNNLDELRKDVKIHERSCVVLENPKENVTKLEGLVTTTQERRKTLEQQWGMYREPMLENLKTLKSVKQAKNIQNVMDLRTVITQLEQTLRDKTANHANLNVELKNATNSAAPRKEYTRRIMEFIGNIRKQRNDIFKVLDDTRDLQKQLNSVTAQLQRQFNYTDDLLFQSAKHDLHAKKAYKLLAALHSTCNDLVELVSQTGTITKEIRDLEVQIDREKLKNVTTSLEQILADIKNFENVIKNIQTEIHKVENRITAG